MPTFSYIAKRPDGAETRGTINAASADAAREELRKQGLMIEDLRQLQNQPKPQQAPQQQKPAQPTPQQQQRPQQPTPPQAQQQPKPAAAQPPRPAVPVVSAQPKQDKPAPLPWSGAQNGAAPRLPEKPE